MKGASGRGSDLEPRQTRALELDGLRAIAILAVVCAHVVAWGHEWTAVELATLPRPEALVIRLVLHGWLGVDLFFVLSGFLITGILLKERGSAAYYGDFYIRRALRILPVFLVALAFMGILYPKNWGYLILCLAFGADFADPLRIAAPVGARALWSLSVEEQFYLVWPVLIRTLRPIALVLVAMVIVIGAPIARLTDPETSPFLPWVRCDGLAYGALLAVLVGPMRISREHAAVASIALVVGGCLALLVQSRYLAGTALGITAADCLFAASLLSAYTFRGSSATAWLRGRPLRFIATTSYCAYIVHGPIFDLISNMFQFPTTSLRAIETRALIGIPATFALAALSWRWLEQPILALKDQLTSGGRGAELAPGPSMVSKERH